MLSGQFLTPVSDLVALVAPQEDYLGHFHPGACFPDAYPNTVSGEKTVGNQILMWYHCKVWTTKSLQDTWQQKFLTLKCKVS